jgi:UDP-glucose:(glucosyl)LPS alpha-1,2-glucosyltransferase
MTAFEENDVSAKAFGGTELAKRKLAQILDPELLENFQIICSRPRELKEDKIRIFWAHDLAEDPESAKFKDKSFCDNFHKFVFISNWQMQRYQMIHGFPHDDKSVVLESGIEPADPSLRNRNDDDVIHMVYTSTPQRGLNILVAAFDNLAKTDSKIHLHIYSSFKIYGWDAADQQFEALYDTIRNHPQMTYHGFQPNDVLRNNLNNYDIFAYPSIWVETSCRSMLEAMTSGLVCVHPNYGALPETSGGLNMMYPWHGDLNRHAFLFAEELKKSITMIRKREHFDMVNLNKQFVDARYNIQKIKSQWEDLLNDAAQTYPTIESRKFPTSKMFVYKTS